MRIVFTTSQYSYCSFLYHLYLFSLFCLVSPGSDRLQIPKRLFLLRYQSYCATGVDPGHILPSCDINVEACEGLLEGVLEAFILPTMQLIVCGVFVCVFLVLSS